MKKTVFSKVISVFLAVIMVLGIMPVSAIAEVNPLSIDAHAADVVIESDHDYENNTDKTWEIKKEGATRIAITFSDLTYTEQYYDYITISGSDCDIELVFSGDQLAGKTFVIASETIYINLTSDDSGVFYGFAVTEVKAYYDECDHTDKKVVDACEPTCSKDGYTGTTVCADCNVIFETGEVIDRLAHTKGAVVDIDKISCVNDSYIYYECAVCETLYGEVYKYGWGHEKGEFIRKVEPTCSEDGYSVYKCSVCGEEYKCDTTSVDHKQGEKVKVVEPTCNDSGCTIYKCTVCGQEYEDDYVSSMYHRRGEVVKIVEPTCDDGGYTVYKCKVCGVDFKADWEYVDHTPGEVVSVKDAVCEEVGYSVYKCSVCNEEYEDDLIYLEHKPGKKIAVKNPTCSEMGYTLYECTVCGEEYKNYDSLETEHKKGKKLRTEYSECDDYGWDVYQCAVCGNEFYDSFEGTGHTHPEIICVVAPTCSGMGYTKYRCTACDEIYEDDYVGVIPHTGVKVRTKAPSCGEWSKGYTVYECTVCGYSYEDDYVDPIPHTCTGEGVAFEATCTEYGYTEKYCTVCKEFVETDIVPAKGHSFENDVCNTCGILRTDALEGSCTEDESCDESWVISKPGAISIDITFSRNTYLGDYDGLIYVYDASDDMVGLYTYLMLTERTIRVFSDTVKIRYEAEGYSEGHGYVDTCFAVTDVKANYDNSECTHQETIIVNPVEATCTEAGYTGDVCCVNCMKLIEKGSETPVIPHEPDDAEIENPVIPTSMTEGSYDEVIYCWHCDEELERKTVVIPAYETIKDVSIEDIALNYKDADYIDYEVQCDEEVWYDVEFSSSDASVAVVDEYGFVETTGVGEAEITITVTDDYGKVIEETCTVTVSYTWWQWLIVIFLFGWIWY